MGSLKTFSFGACQVSKYSPPRRLLNAETKVLNIVVSFEEALKLNLAVDECIRELNKLKRSSKEGQRAAVNLILLLDKQRLAIAKGKV